MWADGVGMRLQCQARAAARRQFDDRPGPWDRAMTVLYHGVGTDEGPGSQLCLDLDRLGTTPDEVAITLWHMGVAGSRYDSLHCPVATYLRARGWELVRLSKYAATAYWSDQRVATNLHLPVEQFTDRFDHGWYPQLGVGHVG